MFYDSSLKQPMLFWVLILSCDSVFFLEVCNIFSLSAVFSNSMMLCFGQGRFLYALWPIQFGNSCPSILGNALEVIFFFFFNWKVGFIGGHKQGTVPWLSWTQGPPFVLRATIGDIFDPTPIWDELLFCQRVFKFICFKLSKSPLLGDMDFQVSRKLSRGSAEDLSHRLPVLQLGEIGHRDLGSVDPGHCALGLSKGILHTCQESITLAQDNILLMQVT